MKHLFIVDTKAGTEAETTRTCEIIRSFFMEQGRGARPYDIHLTRWSRDAVSAVRRYAESSRDIVRVYASGGDSCLFDVLNGAIGLANTQIACFDLYGRNSFIRAFGESQVDLFGSLGNLTAAETRPADVIKCGISYAINSVVIGSPVKSALRREAYTGRPGGTLPERFASFADSLTPGRKSRRQQYDITIGSEHSRLTGEAIYVCNGKRLPIAGSGPMRMSKPNDGLLELAVVYSGEPDFYNETAEKTAERFFIKQVKALSVQSQDPMYISMDGEVFADNHAELSIIPSAIEFVVPRGVM